MKKIAVLAALLMVFACGSAWANSIGLNMDGGWHSGPYPLAAGDNTGAVPQTNWDNQMTGAAQNMQWWTSPALHDNTNTATTLTVTMGNPTQSQLQDDGPGPGNNSGGIQTLFYGQVRCNTDGGPMCVSSAGMPYSKYDLYVYVPLSNFTLAGGYVEGVNYYKLTNQTGNFAFTVGGAMYGLQVVDTSPPPVGDLRINKWNDVDGDGQWVEDNDPLLGGWTFNVSDVSPTVTDNDGIYDMDNTPGTILLTNLVPGQYTIMENLAGYPGWNWTHGLLVATVNAGEEAVADWANHYTPPQAVPEPAGLGLIGAALLFLKRRRS